MKRTPKKRKPQMPLTWKETVAKADTPLKVRLVERIEYAVGAKLLDALMTRDLTRADMERYLRAHERHLKRKGKL